MVDSSLRIKTLEKFQRVMDKYEFRYKIGEGTYGKVFLGNEKENPTKKVAIKVFKPARPGEGVSVTACREISLLRELKHENVIGLLDVVVRLADPTRPRDPVWGEINEHSLFMVFDYAAHDLEQMLKAHRQALHPYTIKSLMWQIINGMHYLHSHWVIHRDLKPSNILVMGEGPEMGVVKIADFGLARIFQSPLRSLGDDGPVVTIWYRAPELLLGSKHYTKAVDMWAIGCIFGELLKGRPIFPGQERRDEKNQNPFQDDQLDKIFRVLGVPTPDVWPDMHDLPDFNKIDLLKYNEGIRRKEYFTVRDRGMRPILDCTTSPSCLDLLKRLLEFDPKKRISAADALEHPYFREDPQPCMNAFLVPLGGEWVQPTRYPERVEVRDPASAALPSRR